MRYGALVLILVGAALYLVSWLVAGDLEASAHANPAIVRSVADVETPGVSRQIGDFTRLAAHAAAAAGPQANFGSP